MPMSFYCCSLFTGFSKTSCCGLRSLSISKQNATYWLTWRREEGVSANVGSSCFALRSPHLLQWILQTACTLVAKPDMPATGSRECPSLQSSKLGSTSTGKSCWLKYQIMQNVDGRKTNSSLFEWRWKDPPSWHLFLLISFCLCSEQCICLHAERILLHFLC